jgi:hypothetical protein
MYLKEIILENCGPIGKVELKMPFHENGNPKPFVLIGQNGAGKSIFISHIVNALLSAKETIYDDTEVEHGKVFKYRSPVFIKSGCQHSYCKVTFEKNLTLSEFQLDRIKSEFMKLGLDIVRNQEFKLIPLNASSNFTSSFRNQHIELKEIYDRNCILYFPPNRFEEPGWLNTDNLLNKVDYRFQKQLSNLSNRLIINHAPLKDNQNWLLDLLFDKHAFEIEIDEVIIVNSPIDQSKRKGRVFYGFKGESTALLEEIIKFLSMLLQTKENLRFGFGGRKSRRVEIMKNNEAWIQNIFNLSSGETILLNIFLSIIKDYDSTINNFNSFEEVRGIVVIDEIDIHLHSNLQYVVLPQLIKLFPKIQFILTSHSPLFLLGLSSQLGEGNFQIINLPDGQEIDIESFSEFENAYSYFRNSQKFKDELKLEISNSHKALLFVEGDYDIRYLTKAAELLGKQDTLAIFKMVDSVGHGNITNVAKHFSTKLAEITPQKILLLYDCDINKQTRREGKIYSKVIPTISEHPIKKGIENLFPRKTIDSAMQFKPEFIDKTPVHIKITRGREELIPELLEVNKDEKRNLCDWIIENGTVDDFQNFIIIFDILNEVISA